MRILHVLPWYVPAWRYGGPVLSVHGLARSAVALGHKVEVFCTDADGPGHLRVPLGDPTDVDGVSVTYFPCGSPRRLYRSPSMGHVLERRIASFDIVHLHGCFSWPTHRAARVASAARVPYVVSPRGMLVPELIRRRSRWSKTAWILASERTTVRRASFVHATSAREAEDFARLRLKHRKIVTLPNGVEPEPFDGDWSDVRLHVRRVATRPNVLLYLGRLSWKKGLDRLVDALPMIPDATLVCAGPDDEGLQEILEARAEGLGVRERLRFLGTVTGAEKRALLASARLLLLASLGENFGNVVLEAMAAGLPPVVTPEVGAAEVLARHGTGVVVPGVPRSIAEIVRGLLEDPDRLARLGAAGREVARREYSWERIARRMLAAYGHPSQGQWRRAG